MSYTHPEREGEKKERGKSKKGDWKRETGKRETGKEGAEGKRLKEIKKRWVGKKHGGLEKSSTINIHFRIVLYVTK